MTPRNLGATELTLPPIVFGAWAIGGWWWGGTDDARAIAAMRAAADAGPLAIDTAPVYGFGHSERLVGAALSHRRHEIQILTKCGMNWTREDGPVAFTTQDESGQPKVVKNDLRPASVRAECEASLKRLNTDVIDLYQCHWPDPSTDVAETMGEMLRLREEGKIRAIGVSNFSPELMEESQAALGDVPLASTQPRYSLLHRKIESDVLPWCRTHNVGVLAYRPMEQGLLAGTVGPERTFPAGDKRPTHPIFSVENRRKILQGLESLRDIAETHQATFAQLVLAWVVAQPGLTCALAGARNASQALENARAGEIALSTEEIARIGSVFVGVG